ncbi:hypothetical protein FOA52_012231 [Chlamydomonas sp. UWO 241]|nr:hypothetical protein FOA52_012231 [Chlamydomonas sp. UWO 241]
MSANYWESKWARSIASRERLLDSQLDDRARGLTEEQIQQIKVHFTTSICQFVKKYKEKYRVDLRRRVASTATVYFRRFYLRNCFCRVDPRLMFVGCIYLAAKVEESVVHAKHLVMFARTFRPPWGYEVKHLLDAEMVIMEDLNFNLVLFSPYRSLQALLRDSGLGEALGPRAWAFLNDSYHTDVHLLHPPHVIALAAVQLAAAEMAQQQQQEGEQQQTGQGRQGQGQGKLEGQQQQQQQQQAGQQGHDVSAEALLDRLSRWLVSLDVDLGAVADVVVDLTDMLASCALGGVPQLGVDAANRLLDAVQGAAAAPGLAPAQARTPG